MCQATVRSAATLARDRKEEQDIKRRAALRIARSSRELSITLDLSSFSQLLDDFKAFTFKHQATPLSAFIGTLVDAFEDAHAYHFVLEYATNGALSMVRYSEGRTLAT